MSRWPPVALIHINMLLILYVGAGLATAARLKWDPSTYVVVRELLPAEYRVAAAALTAASFTLMLLAHLALAPLCIKSPTLARLLYITYAVLMCIAICLEVFWVAWTAARVSEWLNSPDAQKMAELGELREHIHPILRILAKFHPLPEKIDAIIQEAMEDAPRNLYVLGAAAALLVLLQPLAVVCALLSAVYVRRTALANALAARTHHMTHTPTDTFSSSLSGSEAEAAPLHVKYKTKYKNGKLVMV